MYIEKVEIENFRIFGDKVEIFVSELITDIEYI